MREESKKEVNIDVNENYIQHLKYFLEDQEIKNLLESLKKPLKKSIKINLNKISPLELQKDTESLGRKFYDANYEEKNSNIKDLFYIDREDTSLALGKTFYHLSWFFYVQEISAWVPAKLIEIKENDLILDISAAPGWKSSQLADYLKSQWEHKWLVVANDVNKKRTQSLAHNLNRTGMYNTAVTSKNWFMFGKNLPEVFDHVLVDAPCSWEGTAFKSVAALKYWKHQETKRLAGTQFQLLMSAVKSVKEWWTIVFSTCTINPYENEYNIKKILDYMQDYIELEDINIPEKSPWISKVWEEEILPETQANKLARFWPHIQKSWGFFIAKLRKKQSTKEKFNPKDNKLAPKNPFQADFSKKLQKNVINYIKENFDIDLNNSWYFFFATKNQVYITTEKILDIKDILEFEKIWVPVLKFSMNNYRPLHALWVILWDFAKKNYVELEYETVQEYANRNDIDLNNIKYQNIERKDYIIIKYKWYWIWVGKVIENYIKNKYIKI